MTIGESIRKARNDMGLTQSELARRVGLATVTIRQYENGSREPRLNTIKQIAAALNVQPEYFLPVLRGEDGGMTMGKKIIFPDTNKQALKIVKYNLENPDITISKKTAAIKQAAEMSTCDGLRKADLVFALRWLFRHYDFLEE